MGEPGTRVVGRNGKGVAVGASGVLATGSKVGGCQVSAPGQDRTQLASNVITTSNPRLEQALTMSLDFLILTPGYSTR